VNSEQQIRALAPAGTTWWVIKNDRGAVCDPKKGGCGKVHEYWTHDCRPVAFDKPWEWEIFQVNLSEDRALTLKAMDAVTVTSRLGTPVPITEREALDLNVIQNPPEGRARVAKSYPGRPARVNPVAELKARQRARRSSIRAEDLLSPR
jgi:hypothetical protein